MSDKILQHVLSDLRPHILPKLKTEADSLTGGPASQKKATVDTHRGETYQFCYFIRKTEPHSVVIKSRTYRAAPPRKGTELGIPPSSKKRGRRKETSSGTTKSKKRRIQPSAEGTNDEDEDVAMTDEQNPDVGDTAFSGVRMELEIEEEKPKPILGLRYQGFSIYGHCLCVVVEPWPVVRSMTVPPLFAMSTQSSQSAATLPGGGSGSNVRARTPLFLPEEPEHEILPESENRSQINQSYLHQILNEGEASGDEDDMGGMLEFSQVLRDIGDSRAGAINDDDDIDGSILFGDADEFREL